MGTDGEKSGSETPADASAPESARASATGQGDVEVQPQRIDIEALGRQRPPIFKTIWAELGFCVSLVGSMLMAVCYTSSRPPFQLVH